MTQLIERARRAALAALVSTCRRLDPGIVFSPDMSLVIDRLQHRIDEMEAEKRNEVHNNKKAAE